METPTTIYIIIRRAFLVDRQYTLFDQFSNTVDGQYSFAKNLGLRPLPLHEESSHRFKLDSVASVFSSYFFIFCHIKKSCQEWLVKVFGDLK